jgi:hypothetical protein
MKTCFYQFEECPNPQGLVIHLTEIVEKTKDPEIVLGCIRGVEKAYCTTPYRVTIFKGKLFEWGEIQPVVISKLGSILECEMKEKVKESKDERWIKDLADYVDPPGRLTSR